MRSFIGIGSAIVLATSACDHEEPRSAAVAPHEVTADASDTVVVTEPMPAPATQEPAGVVRVEVPEELSHTLEPDFFPSKTDHDLWSSGERPAMAQPLFHAQFAGSHAQLFYGVEGDADRSICWRSGFRAFDSHSQWMEGPALESGSLVKLRAAAGPLKQSADKRLRALFLSGELSPHLPSSTVSLKVQGSDSPSGGKEFTIGDGSESALDDWIVRILAGGCDPNAAFDADEP